MKSFSFIRIMLLFVLGMSYMNVSAQNGTCLGAEPFCTGTPITFPAGVNTGTAEPGPDYGCLLTQPNPAWYYMEIDQGGNLDIEISNSNNEDIDFILYGPFADPTSPCTALLTAGNTEDCSYSTTATEQANIVGALPGEFYLLLITNFSNNPTDISFADLPSSTATTNCAIVCPPIDFGVWNGSTVEQTPTTYNCDDPAVLLLADEDGFSPGEAISPCVVIRVFPTNANATLSVEFFENGTSIGTLFPTPNTNWSGFLSYADPDGTHAWVLDEGAATGANMTYEVLDCHSGAVLASGTWVDDGNPQTVNQTPPPNLSGTAVYTVVPASGNPGLTTFDWGGAVWDPAAVPPGSYDITYSWNDGQGNCSGTATHTFVVTNPYTAGFSYTGSPWCASDTDPAPTITGTSGGNFTASPGGLNINSSTGLIDLSASTPGTYDVTYFVGTPLPSVCNASSTVQITINPDQNAGFSYTGSAWCQSDSDPSPTITGDPGTFSSTPGLNINSGSGVIDLSTSTPGTYTVTYTTNGPCADSQNTSITINADDVAAFTYPQSTYCQGDADPSPTITGDPGNFSSTPGLNINSGSGVIDLSASTPGTYTVTLTTTGPCPDNTTFDVTINPDQDGTFTYPQNTYCADDTDPVPTISGTGGGSFSSTPGLNINSGSGVIDLDLSTAGSYTVSYTTPGPCAATGTFNITINTLDDPSFSYPQNTYCQGDTDPVPTISGLSGGGFSSTPGLLINTSSGVIDLSASTPGNYVVTYLTNGPCPQSTTFNITIDPDQSGAFTYPQTTYCANATDPIPTITGTSGGTFSAPAGVIIDSNSGVIDLDLSTTGTYTITYTSPGPCPGTGTFDVTINPLDDPGFSYPNTAYCQSDADPVPTISGTTGGNFSAPAGVVINTSSGVIDLSVSNTGTHTITYTTPGPCIQSGTFDITINPDQDGSFSYPQNTYCADDTDPVPTVTGTGGGSFSSTPGLDINSGSGVIDLDNSTAGSYTVTYTTPGPCAASGTFNITINPLDDPSFSYPQNTYCQSDADPIPTITGLSGGGFTGTGGLSIDPNSGVIDLSASTTGAHTITYLTNGNCPQSTTFNLTINPDDDPSFSYPSATFCLTGTDPTPTITGLNGGTFAGTGGLVVDINSGVIDLDVSGVGTYDVTYTTNGVCPQSQTVTINITTAPDASFTYNDPFCEGDPNNPLPTFGAGASAGTFSFVVVSGGPNLVFVNANTGEIDLTSSDPGVYDITNFIPAAGGCASASSTTQITINPQDDPSFDYGQTNYCQSEPNPSANITGTGGGNFSATPGGLVFVSTVTGEIDVAGSTPGTYVINYVTTGTCPDSTTFNVTITADQDPSFTYPQAQYCEDDTDPSPTITGVPGGTFSGDNNIVIDPNTGIIDLDSSGAGTYTITYVTPGPLCPDSTTFSVTIDPMDDASFTYTSNAYCTLDPDPFPTITGMSGGTFSAAPAGLDIDPNTGGITIANSALGSYIVTYTTNGPCPQSATFNVDIVSQLDATINPVGPFCTDDPTVTMSAAITGGTWSANCGGCIDSNTGVFDPATAGAGNWEIIYTLSGSCGDIDTTYIQVDQSADPTITNAPASVCDGTGDVDLDAVDGGGVWSSPGITDSVAGIWNPTAAGGPGLYTIYYSIAGNCAGIDSVNITVDPVPTAPIGVDAFACIGDPVPALQATGGGGIFNWYSDAQGTTLVGTGANFTPPVTAAGTYTYYVSETLGSCEGPLTPVTLTIGGPTAFFTANPTSGQAPLTVDFTNGSTGATSYSWDFGDGNTSTATDPSNTYINFGEYDVTLVATDANGCTDTYTYSFIDVDAESEITVPNVFSPNNDGINDMFKAEAENLTDAKGTIMNRWGQVLYTWNTTQGGWDGRTTSGELAPAGTYFYIITATGADGKDYEFKGTFTLTR